MLKNVSILLTSSRKLIQKTFKRFVKVDDCGNLKIQFLICRAFIQIISKVIFFKGCVLKPVFFFKKQVSIKFFQNLIGKIPIDLHCGAIFER